MTNSGSEARNCFVEGQKLGEEAGLKQWLTWCDEKIAKFGPGPGAKKQDEAKKEPEPMKTESQEAAAAPQDPQAMPVPKISHDWYQAETQVVVEVRIKKLKADECKIEIGDTDLSVTAPLPTGSEYSLELDLTHPVFLLNPDTKFFQPKSRYSWRRRKVFVGQLLRETEDHRCLEVRL